MKILILFLLGFCITLTCSAQTIKKSEIDNLKNINFISNNKVKYTIGLISCDSCFPVMSIGYRISTNLTENQIKLASMLTFNDWLLLLNNKKSDWAANLVLYQIFDKDAIPLYHIGNRARWLKYLKKEDLAFWKQTFSN